MTVTDKTAAAQTDTITFELDVQHAPDKVWRALTDPELLPQWLLPVTGFDLAPNTAFTFKTQEFPGWDGTVHCRILESEAPKKLRYAWAVGSMELDTVVTFTLTPAASGTHMRIEQSGFKPSQKQNFGGARYGWKLMAGKLADVLEGQA